MGDLVPFERQTLGRGESRQLSRTIGSLSANTSVQIARIEQAADVQTIRVDAVAHVGRRAMQDVAMLTQLEQQLALMVPLASGRLQVIADMTSLAVAEVVNDTLRRVR